MRMQAERPEVEWIAGAAEPSALSSAMNSAPVFEQASVIAAANAGVSGRMPPSPSTDSAMIAARVLRHRGASAAESLVGMKVTFGKQRLGTARDSARPTSPNSDSERARRGTTRRAR